MSDRDAKPEGGKPIPEADLARLRASPVLLSLSGGKDSTATGLLMLEHGINFKAAFADTGWEHPDTYAYVDSLERLFGPIARVGYPGGMRALIAARGFPSKMQRFCTDHLKRLPLARWQFENMPSVQRQASNARSLPHFDLSGTCVTGIRATESEARSRMMPWELTQTKIPGLGTLHVETFRPLLLWTFEDVVAIHRRHGVKPNPLYMRLFKRVGCYPCIFAGRDELVRIANQSPGIIAEIEEIERRETDDDTVVRTFFLRSSPDKRGSYSWPIRERVEWARNGRGGIQPKLGLDDPNEDGGCGTWGLCEAGEEGFDV